MNREEELRCRRWWVRNLQQLIPFRASYGQVAAVVTGFDWCLPAARAKVRLRDSWAVTQVSVCQVCHVYLAKAVTSRVLQVWEHDCGFLEDCFGTDRETDGGWERNGKGLLVVLFRCGGKGEGARWRRKEEEHGGERGGNGFSGFKQGGTEGKEERGLCSVLRCGRSEPRGGKGRKGGRRIGGLCMVGKQRGGKERRKRGESVVLRDVEGRMRGTE